MWNANHVDHSQRWLVIMTNRTWMVSAMKKNGVLQLDDTCNSLYLYNVAVIDKLPEL
jgi:hypothetical protein